MQKPFTNLTSSSYPSWEDVRKRARQLENEIDSKLLNLNKLVASVDQSKYGVNRSIRLDGRPEEQSLLSSKPKIDETTVEIEDLLTKLNEVNDSMTSNYGQNVENKKIGSGNNLSLNPNSALLHTIQRHRDILQDYHMEFQRVQTNIRSRIEREQLFSSSAKASDRKESTSFNNHRNDDDPYLSEHEHIRSSDRLLDQHISIAISAKESLLGQRGGLHGISKKLHQLSKRYPAINSVMQKINWRKKRDTIIIATVISVCLFLMFIYARR